MQITALRTVICCLSDGSTELLGQGEEPLHTYCSKCSSFKLNYDEKYKILKTPVMKFPGLIRTLGLLHGCWIKGRMCSSFTNSNGVPALFDCSHW